MFHTLFLFISVQKQNFCIKVIHWCDKRDDLESYWNFFICLQKKNKYVLSENPNMFCKNNLSILLISNDTFILIVILEYYLHITLMNNVSSSG